MAFRLLGNLRRSAAVSAAEQLQRGFEGTALPFSQIPGPKWPVLGALPTFLSFDGVKGLEKYHQHMYDTYGPIVNTTMPGDDNSVLIFDPREARKVFLHEGKYPKGPTNDLWAMHYWKKKHNQEGTLMTESGEVWQKGRHELQKDLFNHAAASSYCDLMTTASDQVIEAVERKVAEGTCDFETMLKSSIGDVFTAAVLGRPCGFSWDGCSQEELDWAQTSVDVVKGFAHLIAQPWMQVWPEAFKTYREFEATQNRSCELSRKMVRTALERYENFDGPEEQMPWVVRLHKRGVFDVEGVCREAGGMIIAGLDTTYNVLMWAMINLAQNPEAQQKLREEIYEVLGPSGNFTREKLSAMPYLKAVMRESHRLTPVVESITFRYIDSDLDLCGYSVPAGTRIDMGSAIIQRDPQIVDDPWAFRPERFMAEAVAARKSDPLKSLLDHKLIEKPFSFGARMCLGARLAEMEMMILMSQFIAKFRFEAEPGYIPRWHDTFLVPEKMPEVQITRI